MLAEGGMQGGAAEKFVTPPFAITISIAREQFLQRISTKKTTGVSCRPPSFFVIMPRKLIRRDE